MHRTHHCAQLTNSNLGETVSLLGWVDTIRDQGGIIFVDLRDRKGVTQIQLEPHDNAALGEQLQQLKPESVIGITGKVVRRPAGTENAALPTGEVEVVATAMEIFNLSDTPPFPLDDAGGDKVIEVRRRSYFYLDLRRPKRRENLQVVLRSTVLLGVAGDRREDHRSDLRRLSLWSAGNNSVVSLSLHPFAVVVEKAARDADVEHHDDTAIL